MSDIYKKPQSPLRSGDSYFYPLTTADQIILSNGKRLEEDGFIQADKVESCVNADMLDGKHASDFALAFDVEQLKTQVGDESVSDQIDSAIQNTVKSVNGQTGEAVLTADDVGAITFDDDEILEDGMLISANADTFAGYTYSAAKTDILGSVPVKSVNGKTGDVTLSASDVGAKSNSWIPTLANLKSVQRLSWTGNTIPSEIPDGISFTSIADHTGTGFPIGYATCFAVKDGVSRTVQVLIVKSNGVMYTRASTDGSTWGSWKKYISGANFTLSGTTLTITTT